ncbi:MAG: CYTH domain-containing protein [Enterococcaceae bacterium]|nr:CYTH domain-containing protein [Enterococcaceae bacterium]MCI1919803.1 CYTH domain-containing protein [Enterococcaceae bacterium]
MSTFLEIEFKTMMNKAEYLRLQAELHLAEEDAFVQENDYFDTADFDLKKLHCGLRIRRFSERGEVTLKVPEGAGLLEITDALTLAETEFYLSKRTLPSFGQVAQALKERGFRTTDFHLWGSITTKRFEKHLPIGDLALDRSSYEGTVDYELELEVKTAQQGEKDFLQFLAEHQLPYRRSAKKVARLYQRTLENLS